LVYLGLDTSLGLITWSDSNPKKLVIQQSWSEQAFKEGVATNFWSEQSAFAALGRCRQNLVATLNGVIVFLSFSLSEALTFLPEGM
jgi:hypothetical protein